MGGVRGHCDPLRIEQVRASIAETHRICVSEVALVCGTTLLPDEQRLHEVCSGESCRLQFVRRHRPQVVSGSGDRTLKLWDLEGGRCLFTFAAHKASLKCVDVDWASRRALSGAADGSLLVWDLDTSSLVREFFITESR